MITELSLQQARNLHLAAQGLLHATGKAATPAALRKCIARMQLLQIDTIHVVARSPYLVLFSRLGSYPQVWLENALERGQVFETWAHEACFAPIEDLHLHRAYNRNHRLHWGMVNAQKIQAQQRPALDQLLEHIRVNGPVKSSDFARPEGQASAWWGWKDEKRWLEALFASGELMVARRDKFHRVYDLAERVAPQLAGFDRLSPNGKDRLSPNGKNTNPVHAQPAQPVPPEPVEGFATQEVSALVNPGFDRLSPNGKNTNPFPSDPTTQFIEKAIHALGITQARWVSDYFRMKPRLKDADLEGLAEQGLIVKVVVQGWDAPGWVHRDHARLLGQARRGALQATHTSVLSPFDPVVWDRERAQTLFDFDYRLECYTPEHKRVHGYFVLPILCRGELIGRLDAKAHRSEGVFEVKVLHTQSVMRWTDAQIGDVAQALVDCARWHGTPKVQIVRTQPAALAARLRAALRLVQIGSDPH